MPSCGVLQRCSHLLLLLPVLSTMSAPKQQVSNSRAHHSAVVAASSELSEPVACVAKLFGGTTVFAVAACLAQLIGKVFHTMTI